MLVPDKFRLVLVNFSLMPVKKKTLSVKIELVLDNGRTLSPTPELHAFRWGEMRSCLRRSRSQGANGFSISAFELGFWRDARSASPYFKSWPTY